MENSLIVVRQLPVIEEQLRSVKEKVQEEVNFALSLICTEETYKTVKAERSRLNKEFAEFEARRKDVKKQILLPYERFEATYKECVSDIYKDADVKLKDKVDQVENGLKDSKKAEIEEYFAEYQTNLGLSSDLVSFDKSGIKVNLSDTKKSLRDRVKAYLDGISEDLSVIAADENREELLVEYKKDLSLSRAILTIKERHNAIEAERRKREEAEKARLEKEKALAEMEQIIAEEAAEENAVLSAPVSVPDEEEEEQIQENWVETRFYVKGSIPMLKALKVFLTEGGYEYGSI